MSKKNGIVIIILSLPAVTHAFDTPENECSTKSFYSTVSDFIFNSAQEENCTTIRPRSLLADVDADYSASMTHDIVYRASIDDLTSVHLKTDFNSDNIPTLENRISPKQVTPQAKPPQGFFILEK